MTSKLWSYWSITIFVLLVSLSAFANPPDRNAIRPQLIDLIPTEVFVPTTFSNTEKAQIVLFTELRGNCHKPDVTVGFDIQGRKILVHQQGYVSASAWCSRGRGRTLVLKTIELGHLEAGQYEVILQGKLDGTQKPVGVLPIHVAPALANVAAVHEATQSPRTQEISEDPSAPCHQGLVLNGIFETACFTIKSIDVKYHANNIIEVFPVMVKKNIKDCETNCQKPFSASVSLKAPKKGRYLVQIHSAMGKTLYQILEF